MIKTFTVNKNGKIELTKDELRKLLDEAFWDGYSSNNTWTYTSPYVTSPYVYTTTLSTNTSDATTLTISNATKSSTSSALGNSTSEQVPSTLTASDYTTGEINANLNK